MLTSACTVGQAQKEAAEQKQRLLNLTVVNSTAADAFLAALAALSPAVTLTQPPTVADVEYPRPYYYAPQPPPCC